MSICERIFAKMGDEKSKQKALADYIHIPASTVTSWKNRQSDPPAKYLAGIAAFLNVSIHYLLTGQNTNVYSSLDERHQELLTVYDSLDPAGKAIMLAAGYREQLRLAPADTFVENRNIPSYIQDK